MSKKRRSPGTKWRRALKKTPPQKCFFFFTLLKQSVWPKFKANFGICRRRAPGGQLYSVLIVLQCIVFYSIIRVNSSNIDIILCYVMLCYAILFFMLYYNMLYYIKIISYSIFSYPISSILFLSCAKKIQM